MFVLYIDNQNDDYKHKYECMYIEDEQDLVFLLIRWNKFLKWYTKIR
jgi:hypothetical protein